MLVARLATQLQSIASRARTIRRPAAHRRPALHRYTARATTTMADAAIATDASTAADTSAAAPMLDENGIPLSKSEQKRRLKAAEKEKEKAAKAAAKPAQVQGATKAADEEVEPAKCVQPRRGRWWWHWGRVGGRRMRYSRADPWQAGWLAVPSASLRVAAAWPR